MDGNQFRFVSLQEKKKKKGIRSIRHRTTTWLQLRASKSVCFTHKTVMNGFRVLRDSGINETPRRAIVHIVKLARSLIFESLLGSGMPIRAKMNLALESVGKLSFS